MVQTAGCTGCTTCSTAGSWRSISPTSDASRRSRPTARPCATSRFPRWDAPLDAGLRQRCLFDPGDSLFFRVGCAPGTCVLIRPDEHIAALAPIRPGVAAELYRRCVGADLPQQAAA